ncbi:MAG: glycosyltransferase [Flavobacteriaceae bacterium]|nr:glycosyltransferase [Flavobacteriaceae bacterium]
MKILLIQHNSFINGHGGTEKVCSFLANHFCDLGYEVEVATNENIIGKEVYPLSEKVKLINIYSDDIKQIQFRKIQNYTGKNPILWIKHKLKKNYDIYINKKITKKAGGQDKVYEFNLRQRALAWRKFINSSKPDAIITMSIGSLLEITFENDYNIPIINSTNGRPDYDYTDVLWDRTAIDMRHLENSYQKLSAIQVLFENYKDFLPSSFQGKCFHIGNFIPQIEDNSIATHSSEKESYIISHVGSLVLSHKQQDVLIRSFKKVCNKFPQWNLHFWGVGRDKDQIEKLIQNLNLESRVFLNGFISEPIEKLKNSDIFVFPSKYEGFPLALVEAMAVGLPVIGLEGCSGVDQLIIHNENGYLAKNENEIAEYLEKLMSSSNLRQKMGNASRNFVKQFAPEHIKQQWKTLLDEVLNKSEK